MGVVGIGDWSAICEQLLDKASDKFRGSRVEMKLIKDNFNYIDNLASDVERQQYVRAFIMRWNNEASHVGITEELKDIRLLLDQRLKAEELEELHKIDLRRRTDEDWLKFHTKYIYIWPRFGVHAYMESLSSLTPQEAPMDAPPPGGLSSQPPVTTTDNIRWEPRMTRHSSMEKEMKMKIKKMMSQNPNDKEILLATDTHWIVAHIWADDVDEYF
ncbi:hypothetical protein Gogos_004638 [Gossypium gossypioides]|uniref:Uncharacterized protein n=1 Tax=Gossypium gossypioides TaxID=34282 RepID=A0A7J9CGV5_GOSGO|nr:hypothetical protein [Gossypium gossypioides]